MRIRPVVLGLCVVAYSASSRSDSRVVTAMEQAKVATVPLPLVQASAQIASEQPQAPWTLTASDGSGLVATRVEAKAVLQGPLAFTELHLYFHNPEARTREGTFEITLPPGASVSRFAMESGGRFMEAEVVNKQVARRAYDDFLHRRQDPALLEKAAGNQFSAKVFPIPPNADKHLVISFSQELPGARYTLPLRGLPKIEKVDVRLAMTGSDGRRTEQVLSERNWQPTRDFVSDAPATVEALTSGTLVAAQLTAFDGKAAAVDAPTGITMLVDTSASRALGFERYARSIRELVATLATRYGAAMPIEVIAFDQDTQAVFSGPAREFGDAQVKTLLARGAAGASDLGQALAKLGTPRARVVVVTDGVLTAGQSGGELAATVKQLGVRKVQRVDVVLAGGIRDEHAAGQLVHAGLPRAGAVLDLDQGIADVASGLGEAVLVDLPVTVQGATWVYPRTIASARAGKRTMIYARLAKPAQTIDVSIGGVHHSVGLASGPPALVERAAATAEIADLEAQLDTAKPAALAALRTQISNKSIAARVVSSQTSMLVLETDADYARYGIDRNALTDILVVGPGGLEQQHRKAQLATSAPPPELAEAKKAKGKAEAAEKEANEPSPLHAGTPVDKLTDLAEADRAPARGGSDERGVAEHEDADRRDVGGRGEAGGYGGGATGGQITQSDRGAGRIAGPGAAQTGSAAMPRTTMSAPAEPPPPPPRPRPPTNAPSSPSVAHGSGGASLADPTPRAEPSVERRAQLRRSLDTEIANDGDDGTREVWPPRDAPRALTGKLAEIEDALHTGNATAALATARAWHDSQPGDVLALIGLGDALEAKQDFTAAARIYGSIIDLFPGRADLRRFAGERLERIGANARALAVDTYQRAVEERPDHMTGHRLLAYALLRAGKHAEAFAAILAGLDEKYPDGRFAGGERVLTEDAGLIGAAYLAAQPAKRHDIEAALAKRRARLPTGASTRFILYWETDANDVDFHIQDAHGGHAFYSHPHLGSGGDLYADITTGYGPECFAIQGTPKAGPYRLSINYYSQGPMGYGMGLLQIVKYDGKGGLSFQDRPYVIMADHAYVDLGKF